MTAGLLCWCSHCSPFLEKYIAVCWQNAVRKTMQFLPLKLMNILIYTKHFLTVLILLFEVSNVKNVDCIRIEMVGSVVHCMLIVYK
jgi:hypothetical protein